MHCVVGVSKLLWLNCNLLQLLFAHASSSPLLLLLATLVFITFHTKFSGSTALLAKLTFLCAIREIQRIRNSHELVLQHPLQALNRTNYTFQQ